MEVSEGGKLPTLVYRLGHRCASTECGNAIKKTSNNYGKECKVVLKSNGP
jgi:hypothetical protein